MNETASIEFAEHGSDSGRGNLLGIQPVMSGRDFASEETFGARLDSYMKAAAGRGWLGEKTIVVWPENIGTWLAAIGERPGVYQAATLAAAMRQVALSHPLRLIGRVLTAREKERLTASLFRVKARRMAQAYQAVFSRLAREYALTMVGGSIPLPAPAVRDGRVIAGEGPLYSVSAVFGPDGRAHPALVRKVILTDREQPFLAAAPVSELPAFETPAGRLGVLICADSWYPANYAQMKARQVELMAVPSSQTSPGIWDRPWGGYNGGAMPADVDPADVGRLTEGQAWRKYALAGRLALSGARVGVNIFLRGQFWDEASDGGSAFGVSEKGVTEAGRAGAAIMSVWV